MASEFEAFDKAKTLANERASQAKTARANLHATIEAAAKAEQAMNDARAIANKTLEEWSDAMQIMVNEAAKLGVDLSPADPTPFD